ncbi:MAG: hypothetical protein QF921_14490 [Pseudomonadales bacterium]|nr:hypothetical protein [Pseudomonadales bacterium]MDP6472670.1 hypothetical protein [Pseudomonadales bacterium]MDP6827882.1 hypothetical protein [Pseudomonadales bacterium]MDP6972690.1 hypothetical protein [Pseudomonadales bacterium]
MNGPGAGLFWEESGCREPSSDNGIGCGGRLSANKEEVVVQPVGTLYEAGANSIQVATPGLDGAAAVAADILEESA